MQKIFTFQKERIDLITISLCPYKTKSWPNQTFAYSNLGYVLLEQVIEKITGTIYEQYVKTNIIHRLGLKNDVLGFEITDPGLHAKGYHKKLSITNLMLGFFIDKSKYTANHTTNNKAQMCLSWFSGQLNGIKYFTHAGGGGGYYCGIRIYPDREIGKCKNIVSWYKSNLLMIRITFFVAVYLLITAPPITYAQSVKDEKQQFVSIGNFPLENGQEIIDCKIGFRTFGKINRDRTNTVVYLSGLGGTSLHDQDFAFGRLIDTTRFHLILIDAIGNGVSSSPSNSLKQPKTKFPEFTIRDVVKCQYKMLTEQLNIHHLAGIVGLSMGGLQAFQWAVSYPEFTDKILPFMATPRMSPYDLVWITTMLELVKSDTAYRNGTYSGYPLLSTASHFVPLVSTTPEYLNNTVPLDSFDIWLSSTEKQNPGDWNDFVWQLKACRTHHIGAKTGSSLENAAKIIKAKFFIIVNKQDHTVNPTVAIKFASMVNARLIIMDREEGHLAFDKVPFEAIREFLSQ